MKNQENQLRNALKANAIFSFISSLLLLLFSKKIAIMMNIPQPFILLIVGVGLLLFCGLLVYAAYKKEVIPRLVKLIIVQDWAWVVGSAIILLFGLFSLSVTGKIMIAVIAIIVMLLAILQSQALKKVTSPTSKYD